MAGQRRSVAFGRACHKYGVAVAERRTYNGVLYASLAEARYAATLDLCMKAGSIARWERQVPFTLFGSGGKKVGKYVADFVVYRPNGQREIHEVKGVVTAIWRLKRKLFEDNYPNEKLQVIGVAR